MMQNYTTFYPTELSDLLIRMIYCKRVFLVLLIMLYPPITQRLHRSIIYYRITICIIRPRLDVCPFFINELYDCFLYFSFYSCFCKTYEFIPLCQFFKNSAGISPPTNTQIVEKIAEVLYLFPKTTTDIPQKTKKLKSKPYCVTSDRFEI